MWCANTGLGCVKFSLKMYFTGLSKNFKLYKIRSEWCFAVHQFRMWVSLSLLLRLWVAVYLWVMSEYVYLLFRGGGVVSNSPILWTVGWYGKTSLLYLLLCIGWMGKPSVTGFLLTYALSCWLCPASCTLEIAVQSLHSDCSTRINTLIKRHIT